MRYVSTAKGWLVLPIYVLGGLALGLADDPLRQYVQQFGARPGLATAAIVNLLLPLLAVGLGVVCPRLATAWLGALGMTGAFVLGLALVHPPSQPWRVATLLGSVPPVLVVACLGYAILGSVSALVSRSVCK
jgi:hypothetical protein